MVNRGFWLSRLETAWLARSVVWLFGVRRAGKTLLCRSLPDVEVFDFELPSVRRQAEAVEDFLRGLRGKRVVFDEVHRLPDPSELLKVAADHFPEVRIIATGSSLLEATARFRDALTGRKAQVWLTPMNAADGADFGQVGLDRRLLRGGLPEFFLDDRLGPAAFQEWTDSYWARDIQELFRLERRASFLKMTELVLARSGGLFEATDFARLCEISRQTAMNYLATLEATRAAHVIRPFSSRKTSEIVAAPKVYGFDTGFVCAARGWTTLRPEDRGQLWEHLVLNELHAAPSGREPLYWRDKQGHELDFVLTPAGEGPLAIECKWSWADFDPRNLRVFRRAYPDGRNWLVAADAPHGEVRRFGGHEVTLCSLARLGELLALPR